MHANGTFFTCTMTAKLFYEQYFGMTNRNSTHGKNIVHDSGPDMVKINNLSILAFPADIGRKPVLPARAPWEPATLKRRREQASPVTHTCRLMKRLTAQHGGTRMERDSMERMERDNPKTINRSGVYCLYLSGCLQILEILDILEKPWNLRGSWNSWKNPGILLRILEK